MLLLSAQFLNYTFKVRKLLPISATSSTFNWQSK